MADTRTVHPDYAADVDEMTLDYMLCNTVKSFMQAFNHRRTKNGRKDAEAYALQLNMLDSFISIFKQNHGGLNFSSPLSEDLDLKVRLLQLMLSLGSPLVKKGPYPGIPASGVLSTSKSEANTSDTSSIYETIAIHTLLPEFLFLSAAVAEMMSQDPSQRWMQMAAEFMLHATISEIACVFRTDPEAQVKDWKELDDWTAMMHIAHNNFHWQYFPQDLESEKLEWRLDIGLTFPAYAHHQEILKGRVGLPRHEIEAINEMFHRNEDDTRTEEIPGWHRERCKHWENFEKAVKVEQRRPRSQSLLGSVEKTPITDLIDVRNIGLPGFITNVLDFCVGLFDILGKPIVSQLEKGELESMGLSEIETSELKERAGWK